MVPHDSAVVTVGQLEAGSRFNIIAGSATMEGTVRTFDREIHAEMEERIRRIAQSTAEAYRCTAELVNMPLYICKVPHKKPLPFLS